MSLAARYIAGQLTNDAALCGEVAALLSAPKNTNSNANLTRRHLRARTDTCAYCGNKGHGKFDCRTAAMAIINGYVALDKRGRFTLPNGDHIPAHIRGYQYDNRVPPPNGTTNPRLSVPSAPCIRHTIGSPRSIAKSPDPDCPPAQSDSLPPRYFNFLHLEHRRRARLTGPPYLGHTSRPRPRLLHSTVNLRCIQECIARRRLACSADQCGNTMHSIETSRCAAVLWTWLTGTPAFAYGLRYHCIVFR
ncbi:hypothetical protein C8F01DRAFT_1189876 [Mycena amicta]|nr:hypothetical protein C8F01DRAFT_1189876 [Mycena amicta]